MGFEYRRAKKIGPFRLTSSNSGMGVSVGVGPFRLSRSARGKWSTTTKTGVRGLNYRKRY